MAYDPGDLSPRCFRWLELRAFTFIPGREIVHHHGVRHRVHLHSGAVPDDAQTFSARNLQYDWSRRVNLIAADASSGESTDARWSKQMSRWIRVYPQCALIMSWMSFKLASISISLRRLQTRCKDACEIANVNNVNFCKQYFFSQREILRKKRSIRICHHVVSRFPGANIAVAAAHPVRIRGYNRGLPVADFPGNFGNETSGYRVGGGEHR